MPAAQKLPDNLRLGPVHLSTTDLERTIEWYERSVGLVVMERGQRLACLGDSLTTLIVVHDDPEAQPVGERDACLFHFCLMYDSREELARALKRIEASKTPVTNLRDRGTHEAIYLPDPDGNNVELGWDRPREDWPADPYGHVPKPLNVDDLFITIAGEDVAPTVKTGMSVGHVHLSISDLDRAVEFYRGQLGFDLMYFVGWGTFFSVAGYHHHFAANIRKGTDLLPQAPHTVGIRHWSIELQSAAEVDAVRERMREAGHDLEPLERGFSVRDPWNFSLHVVS